MTALTPRTVERLSALLREPDLTRTRYELRGLAGRGGMADVYRVHDTALQREVALKLLGDALPDAEFAERLMREARIIAQLEHPGIVPVYDVGVLPDGRAFYVMKLVQGERLDEHLRSEPSLRARPVLVEKLCDTLAFAHAHGVIHRDLKPQNVMVGAFGEVLVLDWGVAKRLRGEPSREGAQDAGDASFDRRPEATDARRDTALTEHGTVLGTRGFMAPEQARGDIERMDARTDVYALGALLGLLLTGKVPASARDIDASGVSRPLVALCRKALEDDPAARYADAGELGADVGRFLAGRRVSAYREAPWERAWRLALRYRTPILLVLAYLVVRLALIFFGGR